MLVINLSRGLVKGKKMDVRGQMVDMI
jgi:hypothetical protein